MKNCLMAQLIKGKNIWICQTALAKKFIKIVKAITVNGEEDKERDSEHITKQMEK